MTPYLNVLILARHQPLYFTFFGFAGTCVFDKQSLEIIRCGPKALTGRGRPYTEGTASVLPSS